MIVINARFLTQPITGVQRFASEICKRLPSKINGHKVVYVAPRSGHLNESQFGSELIQFGRFSGNLWEQIDLPIFLLRHGSPLLINLVGVAPILYKNKIMALFDLAFKHHPEWFSFAFQKTYNLCIPVSLRNTKHIITDSEYVKQDICNEYKVSANKIEVLYGASAEMFKDLGRSRRKNLLTVSSLDPRKNLLRVIKAFNLLNTEYTLTIVGGKGKSFAAMDLNEHLKNPQIKFTGYLQDDELVELYNTSEIFIYASLFEGFGIPPLEAQACGCACIVSNATCLPEVYGDSVAYCDPLDIDSIKTALTKLTTNENLRTQLREKGLENAEKYNWDESSNKLVKIIENI